MMCRYLFLTPTIKQPRMAFLTKSVIHQKIVKRGKRRRKPFVKYPHRNRDPGQVIWIDHVAIL